MLNQFILDIETRPDESLVDLFNGDIKAPKNIKDPEKIQAAIDKKKDESHKKMATHPHFCKIVCVGIMNLEKNKGMALTLEEFGDFLNKILEQPRGEKGVIHHPIELITYNGKNFDIPALINGFVKNPEYINNNSFVELRDCLKFKQEFQQIKHTDLMLELNRYGDYMPMDTLMQIYLGKEKETKDDEFFKTASDEELKEHCLQDLEYTAQLYNKFYK